MCISNNVKGQMISYLNDYSNNINTREFWPFLLANCKKNCNINVIILQTTDNKDELELFLNDRKINVYLNQYIFIYHDIQK